MPTILPPKVIFVDGFNTVGKDYFIESLQKALPLPVVVTDPREWLPTFQQNKRYWDFVYRNMDENTDIFNAHYRHLKSLRELLGDTQAGDRVLVTNRSFVSALNYNLPPKQHKGRRTGGDDRVRKSYLDLYKTLIQTELKGVPTLMVNLCQFHNASNFQTPTDNVEEVRGRMRVRDPEVLMNDFYLDYLIDAYQNPAPEVKQLYTHWEDARSGDAGKIVQKYFTGRKDQ
jgi:hypothetical protein